MEENEDTSKTQKIEDEDANMECASELRLNRYIAHMKFLPAVEEIIGISEPDLADILTWTCSKSPRTSRGQNGSYSAVTLEAASDDDAVVSMLPQPQLNPPFDLDRPAHSPIEALAVSSQPSKHTSSSSTTAAPVAKPKVTAKKPRFSSPEPPTAETHAKGSQPKFAALPPATKRSTPLDLLATESLQYPSDGPPEVVQGCTPFVRATPTPANPVAVVNEEREVSVASKRASTSLSSSSPSTLVSSTSPAPTATPLFYSSSREMSLLVDALSSDISLPLKAFFSTLHVPLQHLAPIFVQYGFNTVETLDMLCTTPVEGNWDDLKADILAQGRLAGWLAVKKGLEQRAKLLQAS